MIWSRVGLFLAIVLFLASPTLGDGAGGDTERLLDKWQATEGVWRSQALTAEQLKKCTLVFTPPELERLEPARMSLYLPDKLVGYTIVLGRDEKKTTYVSSWERYEFQLDPAKSPKQIFMSRVEGAMYLTLPGIYSLEGNRLRLCMYMEPTPGVPKDFRSPRGSMVLLLTLKRSK